ncbi:MAG TPA: hypothetical protein HA254_07495 [Candidatus Diapherotrites archaeon]|uniref:Uncharacterized protein n=1 Tax=Candidatus Iainarchaeum sp. TaxID=3101447 RepID=A0A7J4IY68_9ARCH|nr:hypothetical protein [Candidatus Diapherotrites archaeon]
MKLTANQFYMYHAFLSARNLPDDDAAQLARNCLFRESPSISSGNFGKELSFRLEMITSAVKKHYSGKKMVTLFRICRKNSGRPQVQADHF